jgi:serine/threonine-protein kinase
VARFQREAKLLASLNHPNIAAIYGLEESGGTNFLVLELVEGETLADQLTRGAIPVEGSLKFALQIAEALEAAHEKGVIHRPCPNTKSPSGKLGIGLWSWKALLENRRDESQHPRSAISCTTGIILAPLHTCPEQASKAVDKRADIWAFGVCSEMLTASSCLPGQSRHGSRTQRPDWIASQQNPAFLRNCLGKDPKLRLRDIGDAWRRKGIRIRPTRRLNPGCGGGLAMALAIALWALWPVSRSSEQPLRLDVDWDPTCRSAPVIISPDGAGWCSCQIASIHAPINQAVELAGTMGFLFFSPTASGLHSRTATIRSREGGAAIALCDARFSVRQLG